MLHRGEMSAFRGSSNSSTRLLGLSVRSGPELSANHEIRDTQQARSGEKTREDQRRRGEEGGGCKR